MSAKVLLTGLINQSPQYVIDQAKAPIYFVAKKQDWAFCSTRLLAAKCMGFDTETRPAWGKNQRQNPCALLQIAVRDAHGKEEVFVLDLLHLPAKLYNATLASVFLSKDIVKLGQSFYHDLKELAESYPHASCFTVCKNVVEINDLSITLAGAHNPLSLQKLVFFYLNRKLAKTQQMSNWARRPLSRAQLHYAAADALVLIHLYDELLKRIQRQGAVAKSFRLSDVSNVLDVNLSPAPKCSLCFGVFDTMPELKKHRKTCTMNVRTLVICSVCEGKKLVTEKAMRQHLKNCGVDEELIEPTVQIKRKRSLSMDVQNDAAASEISASRKRRRKKSKKQKAAVGEMLERGDASESVGKDHGESPKAEESRTQLPDGTSTGNAPVKGKKKRKQLKREAKRKAAQAEASGKTEEITTKQVALQPSDSVNPGEANKTTRKKLRAAKRAAKLLADKEERSSASAMLTCRSQEHKQRKMSMESSLLASDSMWSQISSDCSTAA